MLLPFLLLIVGLLILIKGSDYFIEGAIYFARYFGVAELIIGLTVVAVGTSLPELGVSAYASYRGSYAIAVGNIVGSNVFNIAGILGLIALFKAIKTDVQIYLRDGYFMVSASVLFAAMAFIDGAISRLEGLVLLFTFAYYLYVLYKQRSSGLVEGHLIGKRDGLLKESLKLLVGLVGVFFGSRLLVNSSVEIATILGVGESVIGSTLVAAGTSLPELAVSATAQRKGYTEISIGNIIGSNIFNILWIIGVASLISPLTGINEALLRFNTLAMLFVAILLLLFMRSNNELSRREGLVFVGIYAVFVAVNFSR